MSRIYTSYSVVKATRDEYINYFNLITGWQGKLNKGDESLASSNSGLAEDERHKKSQAYLMGDLTSTIELALNMKITLTVTTELVKGLINCCDDFETVINGGDSLGIDCYRNAAIGETDILFFEDAHCCGADFSGDIKNSTDDVIKATDEELESIAKIKSYLESLKISKLNLTREILTIKTCAKRQKRVDKCFDHLCLFGSSVHSMNDHVNESLAPYINTSFEIGQHVRSYQYDGVPTEDEAALINAICAEEGLSEEDIKAADEKAGITQRELLDMWVAADENEKQFISYMLQGDYHSAYNDCKVKNVSDDALYLAYMVHSSMLVDQNESGFAACFNEMGKDKDTFVRMTQIADARFTKDVKNYNEAAATLNWYDQIVEERCYKNCNLISVDSVDYKDGYLDGYVRARYVTITGYHWDHGNIEAYNERLKAEDYDNMSDTEKTVLLHKVETDAMKYYQHRTYVRHSKDVVDLGEITISISYDVEMKVGDGSIATEDDFVGHQLDDSVNVLKSIEISNHYYSSNFNPSERSGEFAIGGDVSALVQTSPDGSYVGTRFTKSEEHSTVTVDVCVGVTKEGPAAKMTTQSESDHAIVTTEVEVVKNMEGSAVTSTATATVPEGYHAKERQRLTIPSPQKSPMPGIAPASGPILIFYELLRILTLG